MLSDKNQNISCMLTLEDKKLLDEKGINESTLEKQLNRFKQGFPYIRLENAATIGHGITVVEGDEQEPLTTLWQKYLDQGHSVVKFVPASGAASRMFKDLFAFLEASYEEPTTAFEQRFFESIRSFAFYDELNETCKRNDALGIDALLKQGHYKAVIRNLLLPQGMNYGQLPKGLLLFHRYAEGTRTPMEEHLVEGALYASAKGKAKLHFTVSHEHLDFFKHKVADKVALFENRYGQKYEISFSEQKASTDTVAVNADNTPFRNDDGSLLFRPGGHGALIENVNEIDADVLFIKTIDNVSPDALKSTTILWKKIIAGLLVKLQTKAFDYLRSLEAKCYSSEDLKEMLNFLERDLYCKKAEAASFTDEALAAYLQEKLNRPMRVCGMVRNSGEPGGGPFVTIAADGGISLQILESSQIDKNNAADMALFKNGTHFNPVDLVCGLKDFHGNRFDLRQYVDETTGFISAKSKNGRELKALELPGLWNGAMSNWNTVFVEVPAVTFNPVKTVNDLLRKEHQES